MQNKKQAFSFVEIIITISIIVLLAVIAISANQWYKENINNSKVLSDVKTINNSLESYLQENSILPTPKWNTNYFTIDTSYAHSSSGAFWVYGNFTEDTISKKYLDTLPLDPRTNSYYAYWKTLENVDDLVKNQFEIASILNIDWEYQAKVIWNYTAEAWPYNLIREYNGSNFVYDKSTSNLPYNPEELILTATASWIIYREWDTITATSWDLEIYFSDGSVSVLENGWELTLTKLSFPQDNNLTTFVKLTLTTGTIWTKATHLDDKSEFQIYTQDSTAAVRWTIFWVKKDSTATEIIVIEWKVEVTKNDNYETNIADLIKDESIKVIDWENQGNSTLNSTDFTNIDDNFTTQEDIRWVETMAMINKEIEERASNQTTNNPNDTNTNSWADTSTPEPIPTEPIITTCTIWELTWTISDWKCTAFQNNITPWISKSVSLTWAFEMELTITEIPNTTITQYLLYWWSEFKVFFWDWEIGNKWDICFKKNNEWEICKSIWSDKKITLKKEWWQIFLNWFPTWKSIWYIHDLNIGYWIESHLMKYLKMDYWNLIDLKIIQ